MKTVKRESALGNIKIVDFSWVAQGPLATRYLAAHGATVVKMESMKRPDPARLMWPNVDGIPGVNRCYAFVNNNMNKYSMQLNVKDPRGLQLAERLIDWADVVVENFTPGTMEAMQLGYERLQETNPEIIMVRASIQGQTGPCAHQSGFGAQAAALVGFSHLVGWPDRTPVGQNWAYPDFVSALHVVVAIMGALDYRRRTGKGQMIDVSQFEAGVNFLSPALLDYSVNKRIQSAAGNRSASRVPHGVYRCQGDDSWCAITVCNDEEWMSFCEVIGDPEWTKDIRFATFLDGKKNEDELERLIEEWTINHSAEQVMQMMQAFGVPAGKVQSNRDLVDEDPQLKYRDYYWRMEHVEMGEIIGDGISFRLSKTPSEFRNPPPCLGEHTEYVCREILKMSDEEFMELANDGEVFL